MGNISLTSSMRSNLLSLQEIARGQSVTQNRLATGLKVSTAIDNPSSFYTAQSLNNRASDLSNLLDSMSQGIQTIKAASQALEIATKMLEQAKALASQTLDKTPAPPRPETVAINRDWLVENGVKATDIVTTKAELTTRMASAKAGDRIVVWGKIDMDDVGFTMKDDVKLVGAQQVIREAGKEDEAFVEDANKGKITFNRTTSADGIIAGNNSEISDLSLELTTTGKSSTQGLIYNNGKSITLRNLNLKQTDNATGNNSDIGAIMNNGSATTRLEGIINIETGGTGTYNAGIRNNSNFSKNIQAADSELNISTSGSAGYGIYQGTNTLSGNVNITTLGDRGFGIHSGTNIFSGNLNITTSGNLGYGGIYNGTHTFKSSAKILIETKYPSGYALYNGKYDWEDGAQLGYKNHNGVINALWQAPSAGTATLSATGLSDLSQPPFGWNNIGTFPGIPPQTNIANILPRHTEASSRTSTDIIRSLDEGSQQYSSLLDQFDKLLNDASYKGINLLLSQNLRINFNENRSSNTTIKGVNASSKALGLETIHWNSRENIEKSITELETSISTLRGFSAELGNSFSIVSTRETFTESIINVLTEGADKLTIADMNQESANMLALQTRQQLAVNSLSLASQAAQSVLKLF